MEMWKLTRQINPSDWNLDKKGQLCVPVLWTRQFKVCVYIAVALLPIMPVMVLVYQQVISKKSERCRNGNSKQSFKQV